VPRLTNQNYLHRKEFLRALWETDRDIFRLLSPIQQRLLHGYYRLTEHLSTTTLLAHRRHLDATNPSLGARAGKAYALVQRHFDEACVAFGFEAVGSGRAIPLYVHHLLAGPHGVSAIVRPQPDLPKLSKALLRILETRLAHLDDQKSDQAA
jgi:hypothetical protein